MILVFWILLLIFALPFIAYGVGHVTLYLWANIKKAMRKTLKAFIKSYSSNKTMCHYEYRRKRAG